MAIALTLLVFTSCTPTDPVETTVSSHADFIARVQAYRNQAEESGASEQQLAALDRAMTEGAVSFEIAHDALLAFFRCLDDIGIRYSDDGHATYGEYPRLYYSIYGPDPGDACYTYEFNWVDALYQTQPATLDDIAQEVMKRKDQIIECLRDGGIPVDDNPTYDELHQALYLASFGFPRGQDPQTVDHSASIVEIDCYSPVGLDPRDV